MAANSCSGHPRETEMDQKIIDLYDEYTHVPLNRRVFLKRLTELAGGSAAAFALLPILENNYAKAHMVPEDDARIDASHVTYDGSSGEVRGYFVRRKSEDKLPAVVVIHENRGLNPHIMDVARRVAVEGYTVLAPDALSPAGGTPADEDEARNLIRALDREKATGDFLAAAAFIRGHATSTGKVGCIGFCWGGGMANQLAFRSPDLAAAVVFYGRQPAAEDAARIKASLLLHYAGLDKRINGGIADYEAALKAAGVSYDLHIYEGVNHAFNNDTNAARYDEAAARLAWQRTVAFLDRNLKAG